MQSGVGDEEIVYLHRRQDVSSKSYDRWNYTPEKRAAMKKGGGCLRAERLRTARPNSSDHALGHTSIIVSRRGTAPGAAPSPTLLSLPFAFRAKRRTRPFYLR